MELSMSLDTLESQKEKKKGKLHMGNSCRRLFILLILDKKPYQNIVTDHLLEKEADEKQHKTNTTHIFKTYRLG